MHKFESQNSKEKDYIGDLIADGRIVLKVISKKFGMRVCTGVISLKMGFAGELLR
jgi:hypothetical protein